MAGAVGQGRRLLWGAVGSLVMTGIATLIWGRPATVAAATFGGVATGVQLLAARLLARTGVTPSLDHLRVYAGGVAFRMIGVLILGVAVSLDRATFPPLASATGYLGTVLPLLYLETRLTR